MSIFLIVSGLLILAAFMSHAYNRKTERQHYTIFREEEGFEIRYYPRAIMATVVTTNDKSNNFRQLAGYIFGGNRQSQKIAMTAPVYMEQDGEKNKMSFVLPAQYKFEELPKPNDSTIALHYSEEGYYAALKFGGFAGEHKIREKKEELKALLKAHGYEVVRNYNYLGYNAPWDVVARENDIIVKVKLHN